MGARTEPGEPTGSFFTRWEATLCWSWTAPANGTVLYVMNADGNLLELVLGSEPGDRDPGSSPDGTAVVFSSTRTGSDEIYKMNLDGTGLEALTIDGAVNRNPDWQPIPDAQWNGVDQNQPPVANADADGEAACAAGDGANVRLDGSGSGDKDSTAGTNDDIAVFEWFTGFETDDQNLLGTGPVAEPPLPAGTHVVTLRVTDAAGESDTDEAIWIVVDPEPPQISVTVDPRILWPANHRMVDVRATVVVTGGLCSSCCSRNLP